MSAFYPHSNRIHYLTDESRLGFSSWRVNAKRVRLSVRHAIARIHAAVAMIHLSIAADKARQEKQEQQESLSYNGLPDRRSPRTAAPELCDLQREAAKFPQTPLILSEKWDY